MHQMIHKCQFPYLLYIMHLDFISLHPRPFVVCLQLPLTRDDAMGTSLKFQCTIIANAVYIPMETFFFFQLKTRLGTSCRVAFHSNQASVRKNCTLPHVAKCKYKHKRTCCNQVLPCTCLDFMCWQRHTKAVGTLQQGCM